MKKPIKEMKMTTISTWMARKNLADLLERAQSGEVFVVCHRKTPVAILGPITEEVRNSGVIEKFSKAYEES